MRLRETLLDRIKALSISANCLYQSLRGLSAMMIRTACPRCDETDYKKNGKAHHGKQNYRCRRCGREFIQAVDREPVSQAQRDILQKLLLERLFLRGICRVVGVSLGWLLNYLVCLYEALPEPLQVTLEHAN